MYVNPYQNLNGGSWIKTNFHTHSGTGAGTCGKNPLDAVIPVYREAGYGALCISNHDIYTDTSSFSDEKMFMIDGVEYSAESHMLTIGVKRSYRDLPHQQAIDATNKDGGFSILCHPNWIRKEYWKWSDIDELKGFAGIEVVNLLVARLSGSAIAADTWDHILTGGRLKWGFGNDDFHIFTDAARSWTMIYSQTRDYGGIKKAVDTGALYASTGLELESLVLEGKTIRVKAKYPVDTYVDTFTYRFFKENGVLVKETTGASAEYTLTDEMYVRCEVIGENGAMMFCQPVYDDERMSYEK